MAPYRVTLVVNYPGYGGAERVILGVADGLDPDEFDVSLVSLRPAGELPPVYGKIAPRLYSAGGTNRLSTPIGGMMKLFGELRPQIVHCHLPRASAIGSIAARLTDIPIFMQTLHISWDRLHPINRILNAISFSRCDAVIPVSAAVRDSVPARYRNSRPFEVIHNGVDIAQADAVPDDQTRLREELGIASDDPAVVMVGRLHWQKGHETLLEALPILLRKHAKAQLVLAGDGPEEQPLKALAETLGITGHVHFLGYREDCPALMKMADLLVFPSLWEGFPVALLEAFASGTPTVISDLPACLEASGGGDFAPSFRRKDSDDLAQKMAWALDNPEAMRENGRAARLHVQNQFSTGQMVLKHRALYLDLLSRKGLTG